MGRVVNLSLMRDPFNWLYVLAVVWMMLLLLDRFTGGATAPTVVHNPEPSNA